MKEREREKDEFYKIFQSKGKYHFEQLYFVNKKKFKKGCGSYLFNGKKYSYDKSMYEKQKLLFELCKTTNKVLEIGNYMGHSALIMLLANPKIHITAIDIDDYFARPSLMYLQEQFPKSKINFIHGDSIKVISNLKEKFDLFHIDGTHEHEIISKEFLLLINLRKNKFKILFDDVLSMPYLRSNILKNFKIVKSFIPTNSSHPNFYVEIYIDNKKIKRNLKNFKFTNLIILLKYRLIKKLFINRITRKFYKCFIKHFDTGGKIKHKISLKFNNS
jgi:predicted O-methyltransferase YrrM